MPSKKSDKYCLFLQNIIVITVELIPIKNFFSLVLANLSGYYHKTNGYFNLIRGHIGSFLHS